MKAEVSTVRWADELPKAPFNNPFVQELMMSEEDVAAAMKPKVVQDRDFGWAICEIKAGKKVCRAGWNGKGMWLEYVNNKGQMFKDGKLLSYIMMKTAQGDFVPWLASQTDMLAEDWEYAK